MEFEQRSKLARTGETDKAAQGYRCRIARETVPLTQSEQGDLVGLTQSAIAAIERGRNGPSTNLMMYMWNVHRIDPNFIIGGQFNHLPSDVVEKLFATAEALGAKAKL